MRLRQPILLITAILLFWITACQSLPMASTLPPAATVPPSAAAPTPYPTPAAAFSGGDLAERIALLQQFPAQIGKIASSRVEALIQTYDFVEAYTLALEDSFISQTELAVLIQLTANARASLYNTGQPELIQFADTAGWLIDLAVHGDWEAASNAIRAFQRSLPRKPSL
jgi:hypothetical protein